MYKKQVSRVVRPASVIVGFKKAGGAGPKSVAKSKKIATNEKSKNVAEKTKVSSNHVNSKIHFHQDVPEEVQAFIKRISSEPDDINKVTRATQTFLMSRTRDSPGGCPCPALSPRRTWWTSRGSPASL